jgi:hypothetical protein
VDDRDETTAEVEVGVAVHRRVDRDGRPESMAQRLESLGARPDAVACGKRAVAALERHGGVRELLAIESMAHRRESRQRAPEDSRAAAVVGVGMREDEDHRPLLRPERPQEREQLAWRRVGEAGVDDEEPLLSLDHVLAEPAPAVGLLDPVEPGTDLLHAHRPTIGR